MMKRGFRWFAIAALAVFLPGGPLRADPVQVVVLQEDAALDAVPRGAEPNLAAASAMAEALMDMGLSVAIGTDVLTGLEGAVRVPAPELLTVLYEMESPPQAALLFTLFVAVRPNPYTRVLELSTRIEGRAIAVPSGAFLGAQRPDGVATPLSMPCDRDCIMAAAAIQARLLGQDLAQRLAPAITRK